MTRPRPVSPAAPASSAATSRARLGYGSAMTVHDHTTISGARARRRTPTLRYLAERPSRDPDRDHLGSTSADGCGDSPTSWTQAATGARAIFHLAAQVAVTTSA